MPGRGRGTAVGGLRACVRPSVRASVRLRAFWDGFWAPSPTGFRDLGLSEGFNSGLAECCYGIVRLAGVGGGLLGSAHKRFPSTWGSWDLEGCLVGRLGSQSWSTGAILASQVAGGGGLEA